MINIALCDNNRQHLSCTEKFIRDTDLNNRYNILSFSSPEMLLGTLESGEFSPDIAVLDIEMGRINGIELGRQINSILPLCQIIYLSGYAGYVSDVYSTEHVIMILKENMEKYLPAALERSVSNLEKLSSDDNRMFFRINGKVGSVNVSEVLYLERNLRKTDIVTADGRFSVSMHPEELLGERHAPMFIQCHQSYWVNFKFISSLESDSFTLSSGEQIPISRSRRNGAKERFFNLLQQ